MGGRIALGGVEALSPLRNIVAFPGVVGVPFRFAFFWCLGFHTHFSVLHTRLVAFGRRLGSVHLHRIGTPRLGGGGEFAKAEESTG